MKNLTNILSYLWLLLLMAVTACSDLEEEVGPMHVEEEVELTIQTEVSGMKGSTRTAPTESITAITAYAFDSNSQLIKVVKAILSDDKQSTSGYLKIKVPKRTGDIHFIAKNSADTPDVNIKLKDNVSTLLNQTSTTLHYWGKATYTYNGGNNLSVTLIRNMAKVTLTLNNKLQGHIASFVNYNQTGTLVPGSFEEGTLNATNDVASHSNGDLGTEHYLFEHANDANNSPLYAICKIGELYYKIAFAAKVDEVSTNFQIVRNHAYTITINSVEESLGGTYDEALLADPINDANVEVQDVTMEILPVSLTSYKGNTCQVTVPIPNGVTELSVTPDDDAFSVTSATLDDVAISPNNDVYIVTGGNTAKFSLTLDDNFIGTTGDHTISFEGSGALVNATGTAIITLNGFVDMYEMYFDEGKLGGSTEYDKFFYDRNSINIQTTALTTQYVDAGANGSSLAHNHVNAAINMQSNSTIKFTIAEERYLTLLVARKDNAPSIKLMQGETEWTANPAADAKTVLGTYNFAAEGEITTAGRLIRYTLPAGTYTLQRGNNDYLLYYMRVTKDKPTMTDIVQPSAANYNLSWTGGEYGNYLKNGTKYYVDDDATIFTPKLTYEDLGLSEMPLTTTSVTVVTDTLYFKDNAQNVSGTTIIKNTETKSYNGSNPTLEFNAGTYNNLCGTIENIAETDYKYAAFYDNIQLKEVSDIEVKNTIKVGLYDDWYSTEALDHYTEGQLMMTGFKMPTHTIPVPVDVEAGSVESIGFSVSGVEWVRKNSGLGIGIDSNNAHNYSFTTQDETNNGEGVMRTHPRPEWIYRIEWENVAAESMTVSITDKTSDAYFSHGKQIAKSVTILTRVENTSLDIDLDFYTDVNNNSTIANRDNNVYEDLLLETSRFYLKATISAEDAAKYAGQNVTVTLNGEFGVTQGQGKWSINWDGSRNAENSSISSNSGATQLSFTIGYDNEGNPQTEYLIEWVFKTGQYYNAGEAIGFTYNISNYTISNVDGTFNNFTGDTSATIGFTNEPIGLEIYSDADTDGGAGITIASGDELVMKAIVPSDITTGTITFDLSGSTGDIMSGITWNDRAGQSVQFSWPNITLSVVENQRDYYLYWNPTVSGESRTATLNFTVSGNYNLNSVGNTSYSKTVTVTPNNNQTTGTVVWNEGKTYTEWSTEYIAVNTYIPTGSVITIYTSSTGGGAFEMHDIEERSLRFTNVNYPVNDDNYYSVASGETSHSFTVTNETTANGNSLANGVDGLKINGNKVTITRIVVQYPSMPSEVFNRNFEDGSTINGWGENVERRNAQEGENHYLVLANKSGGFAQASLDRAYVPGNYTLTYKIKGNASDSISQVFQYFNDNQNIYESVVGSQSVEFGTDDWTTVTLSFEVTRGCNRLLFDYSDFTGEIYIDDLKLVKND